MNESEPKFTPGPWKVHLDKRKGTACSIIEDRTGDCVARTFYRFHRGERNANGNLISAAPEMYESLKDMLTALKDVVNINYMSDNAFAFANDAMTKAEEALKKARGEK